MGKGRDLKKSDYGRLYATIPALHLFASLISLDTYIALLSHHEACLLSAWGNLKRNEHSKNYFRTTQPCKIALAWWRKLLYTRKGPPWLPGASLGKFCDVLYGKKRGYIHRERGPKRGQGQRDLETIQKKFMI